jgi:hypothetical protein
MRSITKIFLVVLACAAISFAQTNNTAKPADSISSIKTQSVSKNISTGTLKKEATNWSKIKDLFL